jgi:hypothetical protein
MGIRDRRNGPTMAHATYKADRGPAPSRERQLVAEQELAGGCAKTRQAPDLTGIVRR